MIPRPINLALDDQQRLVIEFSDGKRRRYTARQLRDGCPCATCRTKNTEAANTEAAEQPAAAGLLNVIDPREAQPLVLQGMLPVGSYAYSISFSDGHDTGIFEFDLLLELGEAIGDSPP